MEFSHCYNRPAAYKKCGLWYAIPRQTNDEVKPMEEKNARKLKFDRTALNSKRREKKSEQAQLGPLMRALKAIHSATNPASLAPEDLERQRKGQELLGRLISPMLGIAWEPFKLGPMPAAWTRPERGHDRKHAILYCHGGGYTSGNLGYAKILSSKLAYVTGYEVLSFEYRLAPEHPYPAALEDAVHAWDYLMHQGYGARDVIVAGDSAGGNLALCLTLTLKEQRRMLPKALILMSPWTDLTSSGKSYVENVEIDPMITNDYIRAVRAAYAGEEADFSNPMLSPLFGDLSGFPPVFIQAGSNEILLSDSVRLRDRLVMAGVPCRLEVWNDLWHVFQMFPMKKANEAMESIGRFLLEMF